MRLAILLTARCNASCPHCSTSCGPRRTEHLATERVFALMDEAAAMSRGKRLEFLLSGGEPFLDFERLLAIVRHGKSVGGKLSCVTNGYWATSAASARTRLAAIKSAGLDALAVSTSRFHRQFVKPVRVQRVLAAAREVGLRCTLKYARLRSDAMDAAEVRAWALAAGASDVQDFAVLPYLSRDATLAEDEYLREAPGLPEGSCPAAVLTVREDGAAYVCASPGADKDLLALGNVGRYRLHELRQHYGMSGARRLLHDHGPVHFARKVQARGAGHRLRQTYASVCDLCAHIVSDPEMAAIATEVVEAFEHEQAQRALAQVMTATEDAKP